MQGAMCDEKHDILVSVSQIITSLLRDSAHSHGNTTPRKTTDTCGEAVKKRRKVKIHLIKINIYTVFVKTVVQHNFGKPQRTLISLFRSGSPTAAGR